MNIKLTYAFAGGISVLAGQAVVTLAVAPFLYLLCSSGSEIRCNFLDEPSIAISMLLLVGLAIGGGAFLGFRRGIERENKGRRISTAVVITMIVGGAVLLYSAATLKPLLAAFV